MAAFDPKQTWLRNLTRGPFFGWLIVNMSKLNEWLTLLTNVAVVAGIIFLAVEIRQNNELLQSQLIETQAVSIQAATTSDQDFLLVLGSDPVSAKMWSTYLRAPETLAEDQWLQSSYLMASLLRRLESVYLQKRLGSLSEEGWMSRQPLFIGIARSPGYAAYLESQSAALLGDDLRDYMDELVPDE